MTTTTVIDERAATAELDAAPAAVRSKPWLPYKWELMVLLWFAYFFNRADRQMYSFVMPQIKGDLHLTDFQLGLVATIFNWTYGLLVPFGGYLGDLLRRKWVITISVLLWSATTVLTGFSGGLISLIILRSLATGAGESFYYPSATSLIGQFHHQTRALAMSIHQTALYVGVVVSGLLVGWIAQTYGWRHSFYVFGIAGVVLGLVMLFRLRDTAHGARTDDDDASNVADPDPEAEPAGPPAENTASVETARLPVSVVVRALLGKPTVILLGVAFAGAAFVDIGFVTWMPTYLQEKYRMTPATAGFSSMFYHHAAAFAGVLLSGRLTDLWSRRGRRQVRIEAQLLGLLCAAPFIVWMGLTDARLACFAAMGIYGFFRGFYDSNLYATLFEVIEPRLRSSAVGMMICFAFLVGACAPLILGALKHRLGLGPGLAGLSMVYVFSGLTLLVAWARCFRRDCIEPNLA